MTLLPSRLPSPRAVLTTAGSGLRTVLIAGLDTARSLVDRLPGGETAANPSSHGSSAPLGADPRRRHRSQASRSLAR